MVLTLRHNCKTGKREIIEDGKPLPEKYIPPPPNTLDYTKLKNILKLKGIISDFSEVEL